MSRLVVGDLPRVNAEANRTGIAYIHGDEVRSWSELDARVNGLAYALRTDIGLGDGDVVGILSPNRIECLELMFAASRAKVIHTALKTRAHVKEMVRQVDDAGLTALVVGPGFEETARQIVGERGNVTLIGLAGADIGAEYEAIIAKAPDEPMPSHQDPDAIYSLMYTSGSTGEPKGVAISSRNEIAYAHSVAWSIEARNDDTFLNILPLVHRGGQFYTMACAVLGRMMVLGEPDPRKMLEDIEKHRITVSIVVPTMAKTMVEFLEAEPGAFDVSSLRHMSVGSAAMSASLARRVLAATSASLSHVGGCSEGGLTMALTGRDFEEILSNPEVEHRITSVGRPTPGVRVAFVNEQDQFVPEGENGEIVYQGDMFVDGYWNKPEVSERAWRGGWFHSGDVGRRDADGFVYYTDRLFGRIKTGAETVFSRQVENVVATHPDVVEVAVIGVPHEHWGEAITAVVVTQRAVEGPDQREQFCSELSTHVEGELARHKVPKRFIFVSDLPKTALMKVAYGDLKHMVIDGKLA